MGAWVLLMARLALAAVFGLAGRAKVVDRGRARGAVSDFGIPARLAPATAALLPVAELSVAAALLLTPSARIGAAAALVLLMGFSVAIATSLARGLTFDCRCFGQLRSSPIGPYSLFRNALLGAVGALIVSDGPGLSLSAALAQVGDLSPGGRVGVLALLVLLVMMTVGAWFLLQLVRQQGRLLLRLELLESSVGWHHGAAPHALASEFTLQSLSGESVSLAQLLADQRPALLVFTSSGCRPCTALFPEIGRWQRDHGDVLTVAVLARGAPDVVKASALRHRVARVLIDVDATVASAYRALPTPTGVLIGPDGRLTSAPASGSDRIRGLVVRAVDTRSAAAVSPLHASPHHDGITSTTRVELDGHRGITATEPVAHAVPN